MQSRKHLYALGEPFGDSATVAKPGGGYVCGGGGGSSSSSSSNTTTTQTTDKRMVIDQGIGVSSDSSTVTVNALDGGVVQKALDTVAASDAVAGQGFDKLLTLADKLFTAGGQMVTSTQDAALKAYSQATTEKAGAIDQKTMIVLAVAGAAVLMTRKKG